MHHRSHVSFTLQARMFCILFSKKALIDMLYGAGVIGAIILVNAITGAIKDFKFSDLKFK